MYSENADIAAKNLSMTATASEGSPTAKSLEEAWHLARQTQMLGLALSGGGIRSATFCLGALQGFADLGLLKRFDYFSTVSGGYTDAVPLIPQSQP
jgi:hypothetical protein